MKINKSKCKAMKFTKVTKTDFPLEIAFSDGEYLEVISEIKLLGIIIDNKLNWKKNTDYI